MMQADVFLDHEVLAAGQPQKLYLMARLMSGAASPDRQRRPLNLGLVIDRSGSMAGDKISYTRQAPVFGTKPGRERYAVRRAVPSRR